MTDINSVINGLNEITHYNGEQMFYNDIFIRRIADGAITLLQQQMITTCTLTMEDVKKINPPRIPTKRW